MQITRRLRRLVRSRLSGKLLFLSAAGAVVHSSANLFILIRGGLRVAGDPAVLMHENLRLYAFKLVGLQPVLMACCPFLVLMTVAFFAASDESLGDN